MFREFLRDKAGNYAIAVVVAMVPMMGALALAVDYAEMNRQKQATLNALDAAGIATARYAVSGATDDQLLAYAKDFFEANLGPVDPAHTTLEVVLPANEAGGGTLKLSAELDYHPHFVPVFKSLLHKTSNPEVDPINFQARTEIRLKNTLEVALVLDNSGSMDYYGPGSGEKRITLLKSAAKQLVDTLALQANLIKQVEKPVQFALVPFAGSVNVGPQYAGAAWMDTQGISPVHHENFDWTTLDDPNKYAQKVGDGWKKAGAGWGAEEGDVLSRFSLYGDIRKVVSSEWVPDEDGGEQQCVDWDWGGCEEYETGYYDVTYESFTSWNGCVEERPHPYNVDNAVPSSGDPASLFVPMFAPDEPGDRWDTEDDDHPENYSAVNNWWNDVVENASGQTRLRNMKKYFEALPEDASTGYGTGANYSCTTRPLTPLTDITTEDGMDTIKDAIDGMQPNGATNVPAGMGWGWRLVSGNEPFSEGRPDDQKGNDKVVIVLTDGKNTYYTPGSLGYNDPAGSKSTYSAHGYLQPGYGPSGTGRLLQGTDAGIGNYSNGNYTVAMNDHMDALCGNAKDAGIMVMTIALDLDDYASLQALERCASDSRFRTDPDDPSKPAKLFWNATSGSLAEDFERIADELSNLRIVS